MEALKAAHVQKSVEDQLRATENVGWVTAPQQYKIDMASYLMPDFYSRNGNCLD